MKITLISPYPDITAFGLRTISAYLNQNGHETQIIFLPDPFGDNLVYGVRRYKDHMLDQVVNLCEESGLIGITLMTNFYEGAVQITEKIKHNLKIPVIWGGVHPTIRPEESLSYADAVCVGDGEDAILELVEKIERNEDFSKVKNVYVKSDGEIIKNPLRPLPRNLDIFPAPDYSHENHVVIQEDKLQPLTHEVMKQMLERGNLSEYFNKIGYQTMTGRGCPHKCAYCINDAIKNLYHGQRYLRWRSTDHVMKELVWVKKNMPYIGYVWISDDAFFGRTLKDIQNFCREYKNKIALPFSVLASPLTVTEEKMEALVDAGLIYVQMGIQSGSKQMQRLYNRSAMSNEKMMKAIRVINRFKDRMAPPSYDFILDTPYETDRDQVESLRFISDIPKPYQLQPFSLVLYPGTKLHQMAKNDGFITDEKRQIYSKTYAMREPSYLNLLMTLAKGGRFPSPLLKFFLSDGVLKILNRDGMKPFFRYFYINLKQMYHSLKKLIKTQ